LDFTIWPIARRRGDFERSQGQHVNSFNPPRPARRGPSSTRAACVGIHHPDSLTAFLPSRQKRLHFFRMGVALAMLTGTLGMRCDAPGVWPMPTIDFQTPLVLAFQSERPPWLDNDGPAHDEWIDDTEGWRDDDADNDTFSDTVSDTGEGFSTASSTKADWIRQADEALAMRFERIDGFLWFNFNKERDWRVDSSPAALSAYRESWAGLDQGVFLADFPGRNSVNSQAIATYEMLVDARQTRIGWHVALTAPFPTDAIEAVQQRGSLPYIVWEPYDPRIPGQSPHTGASLLPDIVAGVYDTHIMQWARAAAINGRPIEISFGHEMNGDWFTWGYLYGHNGNTPELFVAAHRHIHRLFEAAGASNVQWVWTVNASWRDDFSVAFPGETYVDRLGLNGFNFGGDPDRVPDYWQTWRPFEAIFGCWSPHEHNCFSSYDALIELADLPILISEFASAEWSADPLGTD
jgi:hypothetical protein